VSAVSNRPAAISVVDHRETPKKAPKMNLNALMANPYKEGLKRLQDREGTPNKPTHRWHWPWSKE
jgi:hypothetical protein